MKYEYPPSPKLKSEKSLQELTLYAVIYCVCNEYYPTSSVLLVGYIQRKCILIIPINYHSYVGKNTLQRFE